MEQYSTPQTGQTPEHGDERSTGEIRRDIERRRASIARTVDQAGQKLHQSMDWREQMREHPYGALAVAALAGWLLSGTSSRRPTSPGEQLAMLLTGAVLPRPGLAGGLRAAATALATQAAVSAFRRRVERAGETNQERTW